MTKRRQTLEDRIDGRWLRSGGDELYVIDHVRAELKRLARAVRKIPTSSGFILKSEVLYLLKQAKR